MKKILSFMLALVVTFMMNACGGGGGSSSSSSSTPSTTTTASTTTSAAVVTTLAGSAGVSGSTDGTGAAAKFNLVGDVTTDLTNLYVADSGTIRKVVIATSVVTTLAGSSVNGSTDGTGTAATFKIDLRGITTDGTNLYVTDTENFTIRKVVIATGVVTTLAGSSGVSGSIDGTGAAAKFQSPYGITTDGTNLYVTENYYHVIRKVVIATGVVTTLAGSAGVKGSTDGTGAAARFNFPYGITTDGTNLYVVDSFNSTIRKVVIATGEVTTLAGHAGIAGSTNGTGTATFKLPVGITTDGTNLYVTESYTIRKVVIATGEVTTLAGSATVGGSTDGTGTAAGFSFPQGLTKAGANLYVAEKGNNIIRKIALQ